ncbi:sarcosine oxidase subunit gamma family protein [Azospirillum sp. SYSU D00513]|uniref:sarcosine oxidase subunit gamma n=1 Tax=Azospirillum sp. SYSU D00513 TaxID=2812561 RepID=UPI001A964115|nr:sarcosine oxidase subunit gamma family protein [Azospirillum sp. SYSU D00513]
MANALPRAGAVARFAPAVTALASSAGLVLAEMVPPGQVNLRGNPSDPRFLRAAGSVLNCLLPVGANTVQSTDDITVLWLGPDEWLILTAPGGETELIERLRAALGDVHAAVTDVSGNRARLRLSGPEARMVLAKGCGLDLHPQRFKAGQCAQTTMARVGIILHQLDDRPTYDILVRRSFAEYTWMWLKDAMAEYGGTIAAG